MLSNKTCKKYFNLYSSIELGFEDLDRDYAYDGPEDDLESDEEVIKAGVKKTVDELDHALKVFNKKKFNKM